MVFLLFQVDANLDALSSSSIGSSLDLELGHLLESLFSLLVGLSGVDDFHQDLLVLELVTLSSLVQLLVQVSVDLLLGSVLSEHSSEDSHSSHPQDLEGHSGIGGTSSSTQTVMSSLSLSFELLSESRP